MIRWSYRCWRWASCDIALIGRDLLENMILIYNGLEATLSLSL